MVFIRPGAPESVKSVVVLFGVSHFAENLHGPRRLLIVCLLAANSPH
jgi:hypothetical protein